MLPRHAPQLRPKKPDLMREGLALISCFPNAPRTGLVHAICAQSLLWVATVRPRFWKPRTRGDPGNGKDKTMWIPAEI
jgi:hypothetical protein